MTTLLKFLHIATISIWAGGLIVLPFLFWQRRSLVAGPELDQLHRLARFVYVKMTSPAAFLAICSGAVLIFLSATFHKWFTLKLLLVGILAMLHVLAGLIAVRIFETGRRFGWFSFVSLTCAYVVLIIAIIWVVLAKPHIDSKQFATDLLAPGGLGQFFGEIIMPMP